MDKDQVLIVTSSMLSFSTFLGVLIALIYYAHQMLQINPLGALTIINIYILVNVLFLYTLKIIRVIE